MTFVTDPFLLSFIFMINDSFYSDAKELLELRGHYACFSDHYTVCMFADGRHSNYLNHYSLTLLTGLLYSGDQGERNRFSLTMIEVV